MWFPRCLAPGFLPPPLLTPSLSFSWHSFCCPYPQILVSLRAPFSDGWFSLSGNGSRPLVTSTISTGCFKSMFTAQINLPCFRPIYSTPMNTSCQISHRKLKFQVLKHKLNFHSWCFFPPLCSLWISSPIATVLAFSFSVHYFNSFLATLLFSNFPRPPASRSYLESCSDSFL